MLHIQEATYAVCPKEARGRLHLSSFSSLYNPFQEDINRIIHSAAFRRLSYKTQVFVNDYAKSDYYRTRLTHSLEVAQVGKIISANLGLSVCLTEALCLAHDLGHPPFGHAGEDALQDITEGKFDHNVHCFKILTELEEQYMGYNGLNLTWEVLEGIAKHNGKNTDGDAPRFILDYSKTKQDLELNAYPSLEAQVSYLADDIAYVTHDIEDGLRAQLFTLNDLMKVELVAKIVNNAGLKDVLNSQKLPYKISREITFYLIQDVIENTQRELKNANIKVMNDIKNYNSLVAKFSNSVFLEVKELRNFLYKNMYKNLTLLKKLEGYTSLLKDLFELYKKDPQKLPEEWYKKVKISSLEETVLDYIAGMTDIYAIKQYYSLI